jgi:hypothetical protein
MATPGVTPGLFFGEVATVISRGYKNRHDFRG